jgi:hypothetical protein
MGRWYSTEANAHVRARRGISKRLSRSGWYARYSLVPGTRSLWLDYIGVADRRSQKVTIYDDGSVGYDWPTPVPDYVQDKVRLILEDLASRPQLP